MEMGRIQFEDPLFRAAPRRGQEASGCRPRMVPQSAIIRKLQALVDAGVDIDALPGDWTIEKLMQYSPGERSGE